MTFDTTTLISERWENYRNANTNNPDVRNNELSRAHYLLHPKSGERILEIGTGNGLLTLLIAEDVKSSGEVITTDVIEGNLEKVSKANTHHLPIIPLLLDTDAPFPLSEKYDRYFDAIITVATLHHFDSRLEPEKNGRLQLIEACYRMLKPGGRLVVVDPLAGTKTSAYFDAINTPAHCFPLGHPHEFFSQEELLSLTRSVKFQDVSLDLISVPWRFVSQEEAKTFLHTIHNSRCTPEESLALAEKVLGFQKEEDHYELGWDLFFLTAKK